MFLTGRRGAREHILVIQRLLRYFRRKLKVNNVGTSLNSSKFISQIKQVRYILFALVHVLIYHDECILILSNTQGGQTVFPFFGVCVCVCVCVWAWAWAWAWEGVKMKKKIYTCMANFRISSMLQRSDEHQ